MIKLRAALRLPVPVCALAIAVIILAACGGESGGSNPPTSVPSGDADAMFQQAIAAMGDTTSLRFETKIYDGADSSDALMEERIDEQEAPNKVRRQREIYLPERKSEDVYRFGITLAPRKSDGTYARIELEGEPPFAYPDDWVTTYQETTGFEVQQEETLEGHEATLLRKYAPDPEDVPNDELIQFLEDLIWIDKESGRILRWDVNKYAGESADDVDHYQHWESSLWQFNEDIQLELPPAS